MRLALIAALAVLVLVRVEHLVATDIWIWLRGARWRKRIRELDKSALRDPARLWQEYHALGAGRLPFLIFGVKSYRLLAWSRQRGHGSALIRLRAITASLVRPVWRWYFFAPGVALVVTVLAYLVDDSTVYERAGLLTIGFVLMLGSLAIAAE